MTRSLSGVTVPDELYIEGKAHQAGGGTALLGLFADYPDCVNCGGAKQIGLILLFGEGSRFPFPPKVVGHFHEGLWYRSELKSWPCPVCQSGSQQIIVEARFEGSGLEPNEYNWRVNFAGDMDHKQKAIDSVNAMLADTLRPCGWIFVYGDNGMGKTGLLKAAVAAMCRIGVGAYYTTTGNILNEAYDLIQRHRRGDEAETLKELLGRYARYQLLSVDELGADRIADTQFAQSALFGILDARYAGRERLATLLASNQTPQAMAADSRWRYFESRTQDGLRIPVGGKSLRG